MSRLELVRNRRFDIAVIGGGITGAGVARDAALRGFSVALFEQNDYASGTTSGCARRLDGGLRAIRRLDVARMRLDQRERETLFRIAPNLVKPVEFLIPFYGLSRFRRWRAQAGIAMYDWLGHHKSWHVLGPSDVLAAEPELRPQGLEGGIAWLDGWVESPEILTIRNIADACEHGAVALNYTGVTATLADSQRVTGVHVRDRLDGDETDVHATVVVDTTVAVPTMRALDCVLPPFTTRMVALFAPDGQPLFDIVSRSDVGWAATARSEWTLDDLQQSLAEYIPRAASAPVYWTRVTGRPIAPRPRTVSTPGLVTVDSGEIGGYRALAEQTVDHAARQLGSMAGATTAACVLPGGAEAGDALDLKAAVERAVRGEQCLSLPAFMRRRSTLALGDDQGLAVAPEVARHMAAQLGWSAGRVEAELIHYRQWVLRTREPMRLNAPAVS